MKTYNLQQSDECVPLADSLLRAATAIGDHYSEVVAYVVLYRHALTKHDDIDAVERALEPVLRKSKEYGYRQFYTNAVLNKVVYLANAHRYVQALMYADKVVKQAEASGETDLKKVGYVSKGLVYQQRKLLPEAAECYKQALEISGKSHESLDVFNDLLRLCDVYRLMRDYDGILSGVFESHKYHFPDGVRLNFMLYECYAYFMRGEYDEFLDAYTHMKRFQTPVQSQRRLIVLCVDLCKAIYDGRKEAVDSLFNALEEGSLGEYRRMKIAYCNYINDKAGVLKYTEELMSGLFDDSNKAYNFELENLNEVYRDQNIEEGRQRVISENNRLQLANAQLQLENTQLEYDHRSASARVARGKADHDALKMRRQQLEQQRLIDSLAAQRLDRQIDEQRSQTLHNALILGMAIVVVVLLLMLAHIVVQRKLANKLYKANRELNAGIHNLAAAERRAQQSEQMKMLFVQNMSHDIRTPLNAVVGFSQVLIESGDDFGMQEKQDLTRYITDNSNMLITLVNDIIDATTLETGDFTVTLEKVNVNDVCREVIETVRHRKADGVELRFVTTVDNSLEVTSDGHRMRQVLINLLTNAEKNTTSGSITLASDLDGNGMVKFTVTDTGVGVPAEKMDEIFTRFSKLDDLKPGSGLGLDICRRIAARLNGEVNIDPNYTGGARFWFKIPAE